MAGGVGSRFWPLSTPEYPKQFIDILGCGRTLIQLTVDRFKGVAPIENFWVVTNAKYVDIVKAQIPGIPESHILAEPEARNTAPCIAWACWKIKAEDENANIVVTPSDAVVMNPEEFRRAMLLSPLVSSLQDPKQAMAMYSSQNLSRVRLIRWWYLKRNPTLKPPRSILQMVTSSGMQESLSGM